MMLRLRRLTTRAVPTGQEGESRMRIFAENLVYGFLDWFSSFNSVWETTILIFAICIGELIAPHADPGHLVFILFLSLYATFTQNAIAHVNQRVSTKVDSALEEIRATSLATLQMGRNEEHIQTALIKQTDAIMAAIAEIHSYVSDHES